MPLPPAPNKRAARLSPDQSEAATPAAKTRATAATAKTGADKTSAASAATSGGGPRLGRIAQPRALPVPAAADGTWQAAPKTSPQP